MSNYIYGVDIGGTAIKFGLFDKEGKIIDSFETPTDTKDDGKNILPAIEKVIKENIDKNNLSITDIRGVGLGVPGPVNSEGVVLGCVNLGWGDTPVKALLEKSLGVLVEVGNDANVAALGEMWQGGAKGYKNVAMITLGTGVGGGIIIDEKVVSGANGAGGEIGHFQMEKDEEDACGCGKKGCLEQYASATGIVRLAKRRLTADKTETPLRDLDNIEAKDIFDFAKKGDKVAMELVEQLGDYLGMALAHIACVSNPEIFVIGGGVSKAGNILIDIIKTYYIKYAFEPARNAEFHLAGLGNEAGIYGAARLVME